MFEVATNPSFRRFLVYLLTTLAALLHRKFGLEIEPSTIEMLVMLAMMYILGGNAKDAIVQMANAKKESLPTPTLAEAAAELAKPILPAK